MELLHKRLDTMGITPALQEHHESSEDVNYVHQGGPNRYYNNSHPNQGGGGYNHFGSKTHPNLSYGNPNNALQPPPGFTVSQGMITEPQKKSSEDILNAFMAASHKNMEHTNQRLEKVETDVHNMALHMKSLDTQISQIAQAVSSQHKPGKFPGQSTANPKDCNAIYLRSGTSYESPPMPHDGEPEKCDKEDKDEESEMTPPTPQPLEVKIPFPQAMQKKKKMDEKFVKFLEIFKKVHLNMPLVEVLQQMPGYLKFLKEVVSKKKKLADYEVVSCTENCSAIIQSKMPAKMRDPGSFNISCVLGNDRQTKALCDLGASINLMPLSFFRKLKFGVLKPTTMTLQMADRSVKQPNGILEDVLVRVNDFIFPVDFVVLDMREDSNVPLILGRPFLATGKALIDVTKGELTLRHGNKTAILSILDKMKRHEVKGVNKVEDKPSEVGECKVLHVAHLTTEESKPSSMEKGLRKKKKPFKENAVEGRAQCMWWKKRLSKLFLEAKAKAGLRGTIRVRMDF